MAYVTYILWGKSFALSKSIRWHKSGKNNTKSALLLVLIVLIEHFLLDLFVCYTGTFQSPQCSNHASLHKLFFFSVNVSRVHKITSRLYCSFSLFIQWFISVFTKHPRRHLLVPCLNSAVGFAVLCDPDHKKQKS